MTKGDTEMNKSALLLAIPLMFSVATAVQADVPGRSGQNWNQGNKSERGAYRSEQRSTTGKYRSENRRGSQSENNRNNIKHYTTRSLNNSYWYSDRNWNSRYYYRNGYSQQRSYPYRYRYNNRSMDSGIDLIFHIDL